MASMLALPLTLCAYTDRTVPSLDCQLLPWLPYARIHHVETNFLLAATHVICT